MLLFAFPARFSLLTITCHPPASSKANLTSLAPGQPAPARPCREKPRFPWGACSPPLGWQQPKPELGKCPAASRFGAGSGVGSPGAGAGARTGHIPGTGLRKSAVSPQGGVSPGARRCGAYARGAVTSGQGNPCISVRIVDQAPKRGGGNGAPAARRQLCWFKMAEKGVPGHPLPGSSSGEPRCPEHRGRRRRPRVATGTMSGRGRARCLPAAGAGQGQRRGAGGGVRGERESGAGQAAPARRNERAV